MSENMRCPHCGREFEKKENLWQCPYCLQALPVSEVKLTTLEAALRYLVEIDGKDVIGQGGRIVSMMMDLMPGNRQACQLIKSAYLAAETEIVDFAREKGADSLSVDRLVEALHRGYIQQDKADQVVSALLRVFQLDSDALLGGSGHGKVYALSHDLHMDAFARAIRDVQEQNTVSIWKDVNRAASAMAQIAPQLKEEVELLTCVGKHAGKEFFLLMQAIGSKNFQEGDEKTPTASLRMRLKEAYIDDEAIEFFLNGILKAYNLEYTQPYAGKMAGTVYATSQNPAGSPVQNHHTNNNYDSLDPKWKAVLDEIEKYNQAGDKEKKDNPELARDYYARGLELAKKFNERHQTRLSKRTLSTSYKKMGEVESRLYDYTERLKWFKKAVELDEELYEETGEEQDKHEMALSYGMVGVSLNILKDNGEAMKCFEKQFEVLEEIYNDTGSNEVREEMEYACQECGCCLQNNGDYEGAKKWFTREYWIALEIERDTGEAVYICISAEHLGDVAKREKDYIAAKEWYTKSLAFDDGDNDWLKSEIKELESLIRKSN